ncbi:MAG: hypothetical protein LCH96_16875 [Actinobacteria bacterium]|nr:hypothetical protein [Actinomycetota bacterium]
MSILATPAFADPIGDAIKGAVFGQANPMLSFIQLTDSHGINVWQYELSIDRGNAITATDKWFWAKPIDSAWQFYRDGVLTAIWLLHWILDFGWIAPIGDAAMTVSDSLHNVVSQMGLAALFLTFAGTVAAFYIVRGKIATGVWEFLMAIVIMAGLTTFLANPARMILNPSDGLVYKARDASMSVVAAIAETPDLKGSDQTDAITSDLIQTFIRQPLEMVNFGIVIDGTSCESSYDEALKSGPHAWDSTIRDKVNECASKLGDYAGSPTPSMFGTVIFLYPAVLIVLVLAIVIGGAVLLAGIRACYQAVKASVTTIIGVLPGAGRRPFLGTIADFLIAISVFVFSYLFLAIFLKVIQLVLGGSGTMSAPQRIFLTDILLVAGLVIYMLNKKRIQQSANHLKEMLAKRPGGSSGHRQAPTRLNTAAAISAGANVAHLVRSVARSRVGAATGAAAGSVPTGLVGSIGGGAPFNGFVGGSGGGPGGAGGRAWQTYPKGPSGSGGGGIPAVTGRVLTGAAQMGLSYVTGGASTAALTAYRVVKPRPALPPGPTSQNPSVRRAGPAPVGPGKKQLALPPGPSASSPIVRRPGPRGPAAPPVATSEVTVRRPGQPAAASETPAWRRTAERPERPEGWPVRKAAERPQQPRPTQTNPTYIRRPQGRRGQ